MADDRWLFGRYPPGGLEELGPHVTAFYGLRWPASNSAIVRGTEATLVFCAWVLDHADEAMARGLSGTELQAEVRRRYQEQASDPTGMRFLGAPPTGLEEAVEAHEEAARAES